MPIQGEFFERPGIVLATVATEEVATSPVSDSRRNAFTVNGTHKRYCS